MNLPPSYRCIVRNSRSLSLRSDDDDTFCVVLPLGGTVLEQVLARGGYSWGSVASIRWMAASPSGMVQ
jgi:hypothetical protein